MRMLYLAILAWLIVACGTPGNTGGTSSSLLRVDSIETRIAESSPVQVFVNVKGTLGDGCSSLGETTQQREGNTVTVTITVNRTDADACTMIAQLVDENIQLEGQFPAGTYMVRVNGVEERFTIQ